jgi:hypothetical protein
MFQIKEGVSLAGIKPEVLVGALVVSSVYDTIGKECVITSGLDGVHGSQSLHYQGQALDFRTRNLSDNEKEVVKGECISALREEFDVVMHATHLHIEWQPKR